MKMISSWFVRCLIALAVLVLLSLPLLNLLARVQEPMKLEEGRVAVVMRFGQVSRVVTSGHYAFIPFIEKALVFDIRPVSQKLDPITVTTSDNKTARVAVEIEWKIFKPEQMAKLKLKDFYPTFHAIINRSVSDKVSTLPQEKLGDLSQLDLSDTKRAAQHALDSLGVELIQLNLTLPS